MNSNKSKFTSQIHVSMMISFQHQTQHRSSFETNHFGIFSCSVSSSLHQKSLRIQFMFCHPFTKRSKSLIKGLKAVFIQFKTPQISGTTYKEPETISICLTTVNVSLRLFGGASEIFEFDLNIPSTQKIVKRFILIEFYIEMVILNP